MKEKLGEYEDKVAVGAFKITGIDDRGSTVSVRYETLYSSRCMYIVELVNFLQMYRCEFEYICTGGSMFILFGLDPRLQ